MNIFFLLIFHKQARGLQREEEFLPFQYGIKVVYTYIYRPWKRRIIFIFSMGDEVL
jgi:hypothetical protein